MEIHAEGQGARGGGSLPWWSRSGALERVPEAKGRRTAHRREVGGGGSSPGRAVAAEHGGNLSRKGVNSACGLEAGDDRGGAVLMARSGERIRQDTSW